MITSGLVLHICVGAMLVDRTPTKRNHNKHKEHLDPSSFKCETIDTKQKETAVNNNNSKTTTVVEKESARHITAVLFTNPSFLLYMTSNILFHGGAAIVYTHATAYTVAQGHSTSFGSMVISAIGFSMLVGRILLGLLIQAPWVNAILLYAVCLLMCGKYVII